jgi:preprotein translocase subunit YajC
MIAPLASHSVFALVLVAQVPTGGGSSMLPFLFQVVAIFAIFYFVMIRPQQKQRRQHEERLRSLKRGDEVVTAGGIIGKVVHITETVKDGKPTATMDDRITIKSDDSRLVVERGRVAKVLTAAEPAAAPAATTKQTNK